MYSDYACPSALSQRAIRHRITSTSRSSFGNGGIESCRSVAIHSVVVSINPWEIYPKFYWRQSALIHCPPPPPPPLCRVRPLVTSAVARSTVGSGYYCIGHRNSCCCCCCCSGGGGVGADGRFNKMVRFLTEVREFGRPLSRKDSSLKYGSDSMGDGTEDGVSDGEDYRRRTGRREGEDFSRNGIRRFAEDDGDFKERRPDSSSELGRRSDMASELGDLDGTEIQQQEKMRKNKKKEKHKSLLLDLSSVGAKQEEEEQLIYEENRRSREETHKISRSSSSKVVEKNNELSRSSSKMVEKDDAASSLSLNLLMDEVKKQRSEINQLNANYQKLLLERAEEEHNNANTRMVSISDMVLRSRIEERESSLSNSIGDLVEELRKQRVEISHLIRGDRDREVTKSSEIHKIDRDRVSSSNQVFISSSTEREQHSNTANQARKDHQRIAESSEKKESDVLVNSGKNKVLISSSAVNSKDDAKEEEIDSYMDQYSDAGRVSSFSNKMMVKSSKEQECSTSTSNLVEKKKQQESFVCQSTIDNQMPKKSSADSQRERSSKSNKMKITSSEDREESSSSTSNLVEERKQQQNFVCQSLVDTEKERSSRSNTMMVTSSEGREERSTSSSSFVDEIRRGEDSSGESRKDGVMFIKSSETCMVGSEKKSNLNDVSVSNSRYGEKQQESSVCQSTTDNQMLQKSSADSQRVRSSKSNKMKITSSEDREESSSSTSNLVEERKQQQNFVCQSLVDTEKERSSRSNTMMVTSSEGREERSTSSSSFVDEIRQEEDSSDESRKDGVMFSKSSETYMVGSEKKSNLNDVSVSNLRYGEKILNSAVDMVKESTDQFRSNEHEIVQREERQQIKTARASILKRMIASKPSAAPEGVEKQDAILKEVEKKKWEHHQKILESEISNRSSLKHNETLEMEEHITSGGSSSGSVIHADDRHTDEHGINDDLYRINHDVLESVIRLEQASAQYVGEFSNKLREEMLASGDSDAASKHSSGADREISLISQKTSVDDQAVDAILKEVGKKESEHHQKILESEISNRSALKHNETPEIEEHISSGGSGSGSGSVIYTDDQHTDEHGINDDLYRINHDVLESVIQLEQASAQYVGEFSKNLREEMLESESSDAASKHSSGTDREISLISQKTSVDDQTVGVQIQLQKSSPDQPSASSEKRGPSDEIWHVMEPSLKSQVRIEELERENSDEAFELTMAPANSESAITKRSGWSLWMFAADLFKMSWTLRVGPHKSAPQSRTRRSSDESVSSDVWFSGHEPDEENDRNAEKRAQCTSNEPDLNKPPTDQQISGIQVLGHETMTSEKKLSKMQKVEGSHFIGSSKSETSSVLPSVIIGGSSQFPSTEMQKTGSKKSEREDVGMAMAGVAETGSKEGDVLWRRNFQRNKQVLRENFEEWEEAHKLKSEQRKADEFFMREALLEAKMAAETWEVPVGAVLVQNSTIIARGRNLVEELRDSTAHAELICIREASNVLQNWRLSDTTLYVTLEPCPMCAGAILQARIDTVVWGAPNKLLGADGSWIRLLPSGEDDGQRDILGQSSENAAGPVHPFHPKITIRRGILATECAEVMQQLFQLRRKQKKIKQEEEAASTHQTKLFARIHNMFTMIFCL